MIIEQRISTIGDKMYYRFVWGKGAGNQMGAGIFTYVKPKFQIEINHNKEALTILEIKRS